MDTAKTGRRRSSAVAAEDPAGARERILASAIRYFQKYGYAGTSVSRIASAARMTPANIYWHFPSKIDLLAQALQTLYREAYDALAQAVREGTAEERLANYARTYVLIQLAELDCNFGYATLASSLTPEMRKELRASSRPYLDLLRDILDQGCNERVFTTHEVTVTAMAISTMCEYVFTWYRTEGHLSVAEIGECYARLALRMARG